MSATDQLITHLREAHALEEQGIKQLERALEILDDDELKDAYREHLEQTREHEDKIKQRLAAHDLEPSAVKDATMRSGAIGLRDLADAPPDTPVRLAMQSYAFEHLEIATYELLIRIAKEADDTDTAEVAEQILEQERQAAEAVQSGFERAVRLLLEREPSEEREHSGAAH
jgi:ferritin-like metal-binding protein YciE